MTTTGLLPVRMATGFPTTEVFSLSFNKPSVYRYPLKSRFAAIPGSLLVGPGLCSHAFQGSSIVCQDIGLPACEGLWRSQIHQARAQSHSAAACADEHLGVSLVYGLPLVDGSSNAGRLWSFIHRFRMRVDLELPDMYHWFADCSLHVTLRAIMG